MSTKYATYARLLLNNVDMEQARAHGTDNPAILQAGAWAGQVAVGWHDDAEAAIFIGPEGFVAVRYMPEQGLASAKYSVRVQASIPADVLDFGRYENVVATMLATLDASALLS